MVYYYTAAPPAEDFFEEAVEPRTLYVGKDKFENEDLIQNGFEQDVWFHVSNLSSAHLYLRLKPGELWTNIPELILKDIGQLTKANSILGNKKDNITVIYTPWSNLKKDASMEAGAVSFHNDKLVKKIFIKRKENLIVNRINKTRVEKSLQDFIDDKNEIIKKLEKERQIKEKADKLELDKEKKRIEEERYRKKTMYDDLFTEENIRHSSNEFRSETWEDDFW